MKFQVLYFFRDQKKHTNNFFISLLDAKGF